MFFKATSLSFANRSTSRRAILVLPPKSKPSWHSSQQSVRRSSAGITTSSIPSSKSGTTEPPIPT
ncbi:MAG: hypothetical protein ACK55Z_09625 [bacterium]